MRTGLATRPLGGDGAAGRTTARETLPRWIVMAGAWALAVQGAITLAYVAGRLDPVLWRSIVDLDGEANLPTWWSSVLFLAAGAAAGVIWLVGDEGGARARHWLLVAIGFVGLSAEEVATLHEHIDEFIPGVGPLHQLWPIVYAPILVLGVVAIVLAARDMRAVERRLSLAAVGCYVLVIAVELATNDASVRGTTGIVVLEENAEVLGTVLVAMAVTAVLARTVEIVRRPVPPGA